jgi:hypothetical protein
VLRSTHRLADTLQGGGGYISTVQCFAGMDYVRLFEGMDQLPLSAQVIGTPTSACFKTDTICSTENFFFGICPPSH